MNASVNVYVDGFNLYFGALKSKPHLKWLDLRRFSEALYDGNPIGKVYYFTADIHRQDEFDLAPSRQNTYLKALADSGVQIVKGHFSRREKHLRVVGGNSANPEIAHVWQFEEKGSDVNLASYLLRDVYAEGLERALVISGDSDLAKAMIFARDFGAHVSLAIPDRHENGSANLKAAADYVQFVKNSQLETRQFPKALIIGSGRELIRPKEWS